MKNEMGIDDIFKHGLADPVDEAEFRESDWGGIENMLDENRGSGKVFWLPILASVAAMLLLVLGWCVFKPRVTQQNNQQVVSNAAYKTKAPAATATQAQQAAINGGHEKGITAMSKSAYTVRDGKAFTQQSKSQYLAGNLNNMKRAAGGSSFTGRKLADKAPAFGANKILDTTRSGIALAAIDPPSDLNSPFNLNGKIASLEVPEPVETPAVSPKKDINALAISSVKVVKQQGASVFHPQFTLSVLAASEVNGVGSFQSMGKGTNVGLMFSVGVKKFTISTGANYSSKPYTLPFDQYHTSYKFKSTPEYVSADCRVLDIPINFGYQLYNKSRNKISVGTGISSYIMMHESYTYDYGNTSTLYGPSYYAVKGKGKYMFSIMNLQASYERKINSQVGISLQPYLKIPLSNIGYSQVKVQTFGVAVGLNWNINSLTKPK